MKPMSEMTDEDTCWCGDYRRDHVDGIGRCRLNGLGHGVPGYECERFILANQYDAELTRREGKKT